MVAETPEASGSLFAPLIFALTALLPFVVGTLLADVAGFPIRLEVFLAGAGALAALILAAAAARKAFAPGAARYPAWGPISPSAAKGLGYGLLALAALLGLILQFGLHTGNWTLPLVAGGILGGYFYFAPPLQWYRRGWGEVLGALCLGQLPVIYGFYLQCGHVVTELLLYGVALSLAAFNLLLVHGFPALEGDPPLGGGGPGERDSLAARVRPVTAALVFTLVNILIIAGLVFDLLFPANLLPFWAGFIFLIILAVVNQEVLKRQAYRREAGIRLLCRLTLAQHLAMGLVFTISLWLR